MSHKSTKIKSYEKFSVIIFKFESKVLELLMSIKVSDISVGQIAK